MRFYFILSLLLLWGVSQSNAVEVKVSSPDGKATIVVSSEPMLHYYVLYNGVPVIDRSKLDWDIVHQPAIGRLPLIEQTTKSEIRETWQPVLKQHKNILNHCNESVIKVTERFYPGRQFNLIVRAYNDGVAFRYHFDKNFSNSNVIPVHDEKTEFNIPGNPILWAADYEHFNSHQEKPFVAQLKTDLEPAGLYGLPLTYRVSDTIYASITEAALTDWSGMYLKYNPLKNRLVSTLAPPKGDPDNKIRLHINGERKSPWRVIMLGEKPGDLVESEIIMNLNEPCEYDDPSWIKPGLCAWDNWWSGGVKMDTETIKKYIDLASENKFPYMLIDWQWYGKYNDPEADVTTVNEDVDMKNVRKYAAEKNVKLWLWLYWSDIDRKMEEAFKLYESWGIAGIKIDFMARDDQEMVNWYHNTVRMAAKYHLMVNFHGAYKPTGIRRTLPNLMTREGVLGNEHNKWSMNVTPEHDCTLPFTRMLAGPMDYTPGGFLNKGLGQFKAQKPTQTQGTRCHELAKFVVFDSPIITVCDHPDHYKDQKGLEFLKIVPAEWNDTKVLAGLISEYIIMARQSDKGWFIGALNGSFERKAAIVLSEFLPEGNYQIVAWSDKVGGNADDLELIQGEVKHTDQVNFTMAAGGGFVAYIRRK